MPIISPERVDFIKWNSCPIAIIDKSTIVAEPYLGTLMIIAEADIIPKRSAIIIDTSSRCLIVF